MILESAFKVNTKILNGTSHFFIAYRYRWRWDVSRIPITNLFFIRIFRIMAFKSYNTALASFKVYRVEIARSDLRFSLSFSHFISCTLIIITYVYALLHLYFSLILILIEWRHCERQLNGWNALYVCHTYHWKICESEWSLFGTRSPDLGVGCINFVRMVAIKKYL